MLVRPMAEADLEGVLAIADSLPTAPHWSQESYVAVILSDVKPRRVGMVAEDEGGLAGFAVAGVMAPEADLESIAVKIGLQRQGIGRALLAGLVPALKRAGVTELNLEVRESNRAALEFYERTGFQKAGRRRGYYRGPDEDALLLRLELTQIQ
jgi:ribosomal-protein-alanine N-acetyltransferase